MINLPLEVGEEIKLRTCRHWVNLVPVTISALVLVVAAAVLSYAAGRHPKLAGTVIPTGAFVTISLILTIIAIGLYLAGWWVYRRNLLVLTNIHLIKVEQDGLFARKISQLSLSRVQDVNGSRNGIVATILNYGRVEVQTAGEQEEFVFIQMPHPADLANQLVKAHDEYVSTNPDDGLGGEVRDQKPEAGGQISAAGDQIARPPAFAPPTPVAEQPAPEPRPEPVPVESPTPATPEPPAQPASELPNPVSSTPDLRPQPSGPQPLVENQAADLEPPSHQS